MTLLLATDLDGTILFDRSVSERDREAMRRWRQAGNLLVVDTGKSVFATRDTLEPAGVDFDYAITFTGAVLADGDYEVLQTRYLPEGLAREVVLFLQGIDGLTVFATTIDVDYILTDTYNELSPILQVFEPMELAAMDGRDFIGVPLRVRDDEVRDRIAADLTERFGDQIEVIRNQEFLDVIPAGATKGSGLRDLVSALTAPGATHAGESIQTWSIGDSWNDIPMHEAADHAVALPWSPSEVTAVCEHTVASIAELIDSLLDSGPVDTTPAGSVATNSSHAGSSPSRHAAPTEGP